MAETEEPVRSKHIRLGVYADPGTGKTDLVGSSQHLGPTLLIRPPIDHIDSILDIGPNLKQRVIRAWVDMDELRDELRAEGEKWEWVWLDSASLAYDVLIDDIWETVITEKPHRKRFGLDKQEFGINMHRLGLWMREIIGPDLFNFGFTAHPEPYASPDKDEDGDPIEKLMPWIQGKQMPNKFSGYMNMVGRLEKGKGGKRIFKTTSGEHHYGKDQFDAIPPKGIVIPRSHGMEKITDLIYQARPAMKPGRTTTKRRGRARTKSRRVTPKGR
jgi:hypothetical protein